MISESNNTESSQLPESLPNPPEPVVPPVNPIEPVNPVDAPDDNASEMPQTLIHPPLPPDEVDDMPTIVLPMQLVDLGAAALTDVGQQREHNEDYFGVTLVMDQQQYPTMAQAKAKGLYVLCDGMGGHAGGEVASRMAVETLQEELRQSWYGSDIWGLPDQSTIVAAIHAANDKIYRQNLDAARMGNGRMGTTLVMMFVCGNQVAIAHVGDSRVYNFSRKQGLNQLTTDHEVGQREIQKGTAPDEAYARPDAYQLTQALGPRDNQFVDPGITFMELSEDTLFVLASDGLTDNDLLEQCWPTTLEPMLNSQLGLEQGVRQLIDLGNQYNGHDNITAIAVRLRVRPDMIQYP
ncbi:serine/threonine phosphatase [filamentous cyanobacterium LEGE 11480]|uniref:Serine/threonine phosphatase n=1 Tax=Romeriopsis navalis LEGE 11480 TaxID=2777977 RepID=A0A928VPG5_9CYAN|nr:serine/threonine phosphatase [Romeriopsis navalis]MBE9031418.1 serine/threonine phosphatase [Romeriopsis navalis LEGE 11480]